MKITCDIWSIVALTVVTSFCGMGVHAEDGNLTVSDEEIRVRVPVQLSSSLPLQLGPSFRAQYTPDPSSAGSLRLGKIVLEQGFQYPPLFGDIYSGNSIGGHLLTSVRDGLPKLSYNSAFLTSWLNKQWASVNLSLAHTHLIETSEEQLTWGIYKTFSALNNTLFLTVGEYLFNDLSNRYWYRTTDLSLDYAWKLWNLSMFLQQQEDSSTREHSVWAAIKKSF